MWGGYLFGGGLCCLFLLLLGEDWMILFCVLWLFVWGV